jgi:hypothetical protein
MQIHVKPLKQASICPYMLSWQHMKIITQHLIHAKKCSYLQSLLYRLFNVAQASFLTYADT